MATTIKEKILNISSGQSSNTVDISRHSNTQNRVAALSQLIFPLTKPATDSQGSTIQLWSTPGLRLWALCKDLMVLYAILHLVKFVMP